MGWPSWPRMRARTRSRVAGEHSIEQLASLVFGQLAQRLDRVRVQAGKGSAVIAHQLQAQPALPVFAAQSVRQRDHLFGALRREDAVALGAADRSLDELVFETRVGDVEVSLDRGREHVSATLTSPPPSVRPIDPALLARLLSLFGWTDRDLEPTLPPAVAEAETATRPSGSGRGSGRGCRDHQTKPAKASSSIANAPATLECRLTQIVDLAGPSNRVAFGEVVGIHIRDNCLRDGMFDVTSYQPLVRLGYRDFARVTEVFSMPRPGQ